MFAIEFIWGWLIADLLFGIFHEIGDSDRFGNLPIVKFIAAANIDHHKNPLAIVRQGYVSRNISSWIGTLIIGALWLSIFGVSWILIGFAAGGFMLSEVHKWAHSPRSAPYWARNIQKTGFFQSPKHHAIHHRPPHNKRFCVLTDYVNPVMDYIRRR